MGSSGRVIESPVWRGVIGVATRDNFFDKNGNDNGSKLVQMSASLALSHQGRGRTKTPSECNFCCNHDHCQGALISGCSLFFCFLSQVRLHILPVDHGVYPTKRNSSSILFGLPFVILIFWPVLRLICIPLPFLCLVRLVGTSCLPMFTGNLLAPSSGSRTCQTDRLFKWQMGKEISLSS